MPSGSQLTIAEDKFEARVIFRAWNALIRIKTPSPHVASITQELRQALADIGYLIETDKTGVFHLKRKALNTSAQSPLQMP